MKSDLKIISINLGKREKIALGQEVVETGIFKRPTPDRVQVNEQGLVEDVVVDTAHHGGADQAIYLYSLEDYAWWSQELQKEIPVATFGENITLSSFGGAPLKIGDRFQINDVLLEATAPRVPCAKLAARMGDPGFVKRFVQAQRPGVYVRVLETGELRAGDAVTRIPAVEDYPTVIELYALWHSRERNPELLRRGLEAPLADRARAAFQFWLDQIE